MSGRYGELDYHRLTKGGVAFGVGLFVLGTLAEVAASTVFGAPAGWGAVLLTDLELVGVAIAFAAPFLFGIVLPLVE